MKCLRAPFEIMALMMYEPILHGLNITYDIDHETLRLFPSFLGLIWKLTIFSTAEEKLAARRWKCFADIDESDAEPFARHKFQKVNTQEIEAFVSGRKPAVWVSNPCATLEAFWFENVLEFVCKSLWNVRLSRQTQYCGQSINQCVVWSQNEWFQSQRDPGFCMQLSCAGPVRICI